MGRIQQIIEKYKRIVLDRIMAEYRGLFDEQYKKPSKGIKTSTSE
ncbi:hypothetical protein ACFPA1_08725 [Neobacillus sp. GCM10023253]